MQWLVHHHHREAGEAPAPHTRGHVLNWWGWVYDLLARFGMRFILGGSEHALRQTTADLAQLQPGEAVLDVGCGTGTLAMVARLRVGETGSVTGIDPSVQLLTRARRKAARRGLEINFQLGVIEQLPFPDQSFNVVLSTLMMHHLPDDLKRQGLVEIARVLKPGGRLLVVDVRRPEEHHDRPAQLVGQWNSGIQDQPALMKEAGFSQIETGETPFRGRLTFREGLGFALGMKSLAEEGKV
jgi:ubiquinone/menaquinone biosynthesis C-methylase UbiE